MRSIAKFSLHLVAVFAFIAITWLVSDYAWHKAYAVDEAEIQRHYLAVMYADTTLTSHMSDIVQAPLQFIEHKHNTSSTSWFAFFCCIIIASLITTYVVERSNYAKHNKKATIISALVSVIIVAFIAMIFRIATLTPVYITICVAITLLCSAYITEHYNDIEQ